MLSAGPFVCGIEYATGKTATLVGKPSPDFFGMALRDMGLKPGDAVMIGDDVVTDTGGAMKAGMQGILVKTGKFSQKALSGADPTTYGSYRFYCRDRYNALIVTDLTEPARCQLCSRSESGGLPVVTITNGLSPVAGLRMKWWGPWSEFLILRRAHSQ